MSTRLLLGLAATALVIGSLSASAQTSPPAAPATMPLHGQAMSGDQSAAEGNGNQAVSTTSADATTPAKGANSFTAAEAARRIGRHGFATVSGLTKDQDGIWRGTAMKNGTAIKVWLDYKGSVGAE